MAVTTEIRYAGRFNGGSAHTGTAQFPDINIPGTLNFSAAANPKNLDIALHFDR
jgi:hypothetical protein